MTRPAIFINGRFLVAATSGVQRAARELVAALDGLLTEQPGDIDWTLVRPASAAELPGLRTVKQQALAGPRGQAWEQFALPGAVREDMLLNLANTAPLAVHRNIILVHDAQVFDAPSSYSLAFRVWYALMQPSVCRRAALVLTVSHNSASRLARHGVIADATRAVVVPNGVDHILAAPADDGCLARFGLAPFGAGGRPYLFGIASGQPHKNTQLFAQLAGDPRLAGFDIALAGAVSQAPSNGNLRMLGRVADPELRALYAGAFAFLLPSLTEGFGLPAGEAMLCGCPALVSTGGALPEVWSGGAVVLAPDQPDAWASAILELKDNPKARADLAARGLAHARPITWRAAAGKLRAACEAAMHPVGV